MFDISLLLAYCIIRPLSLSVPHAIVYVGGISSFVFILLMKRESSMVWYSSAFVILYSKTCLQRPLKKTKNWLSRPITA